MKTNIIKLILITAAIQAGQNCMAQDPATITGIITAFENCPLNRATIKSLKTGNLAQSDSIGRFKIDCIYSDVLQFSAAGNHISPSCLEHGLGKFPNRGMKDYSRYQNIYELVNYEFYTLRVDGANIYNIKAISFSMSAQVLYVVNDMVVSDISFVRPGEVKKIEFIEDSEATVYGVRGANGVLKITLRP
jgi:hypothetical protein